MSELKIFAIVLLLTYYCFEIQPYLIDVLVS
jgi:hypothetical protein